MRILHLADLHIGKKIKNQSLLEDEEYILKKILQVIDEKKVQTVCIAGDVYDKSIPSEEAVKVFDQFLVSLAKRKLNVLMIAGNHDSAQRLAFGDKLIEAANIYVSPIYDGTVKKVTLQDDYGDIHFYLLPFVKMSTIKHFFPEEEINTYTDALHVAIEHMNIDPSQRNIILSHQFVTGATKGGSEDDFSLGGTDNVDSWVYENFDYTALGHIHRPQIVKKKNIRYSGSPIKFSFDEENQDKELIIVDLKEKGTLEVEELPLQAKRDFITLKDSYNKLINGEGNANDFIRIVLTDEDDVPNAFSNLTIKYPNLLNIEYDNQRTRNTQIADGGNIDFDLQPIELFKQFYTEKNGQALNDDQEQYIQQCIKDIWGD